MIYKLQRMWNALPQLRSNNESATLADILVADVPAWRTSPGAVTWQVLHDYRNVSRYEHLESPFLNIVGKCEADSGLESREYGGRDSSRWPRGTIYPQKLALTSPTSGGRSVGIVRARTDCACLKASHKACGDAQFVPYFYFLLCVIFLYKERNKRKPSLNDFRRTKLFLGRSRWQRGVRHEHCGRGFETHWRHGYVCDYSFFLFVATSWLADLLSKGPYRLYIRLRN
jgi:hypothetical protein